jgi:predicted metal-binding membrane protein
MESSAADLTARLLRNERAIIACMVALLTTLSWAFLVSGAQMANMEPPLTAIIAMWWLMMLAMMLPSATPAILLYARVRQTRAGDAAIAQSWVFLAGYLAVWLLFSIIAAAAQSLAIDSSIVLRSRTAQGAVLVAAGLYQLSPLKSACVSQCRSPGEFISRHWRPGWVGALRLGIIHGAYCVGCCWMLMGLLFVGGVMNLIWIVGLTVLVAAEKLLPGGSMLPKISGVAFVLGGVVTVLA